MGIFDEVNAQHRAHAKSLPRELIESLPRLDKPESKIVLTAERMVVQRGLTCNLRGVAASVEGCIVYADEYEDCPFCLRKRKHLLDQAAGDTKYACSQLRQCRGYDLYWCNDCQGTGWTLEEWPTVIARLRIVTWEDKARAMSPDELHAFLTKPPVRLPGSGGMPKDVVMAEAARRLKELAPA